MSLRIQLDPFLTIPVIALSGISLFITITTSPDLFIPQLLFLIIGFLLLIFISSFNLNFWTRFIWFIYFFSLLLLLLTFLGPKVRGATRWVEVGWFRIQPSEIFKPFFIIFFSYLISIKDTKDINSFLRNFGLFLPIIFLVFKQPDLGNVIVFCAIFIALTIVSGVKLKYLLIAALFLTVFLPLFWKILASYQRLRIISFLNPYADPIGAGYNALQSMIAIGSGRFFGLGLGRGTQSRLLFLPEYHTDFVFASLGEELGFFGGLLVLMLYFSLLGRILMIAYSTADLMGKLLTIGIFSQFFTQIFINIGMNLGILPITGITLPLVSYGGSSIISTFIGLGFVSSVIRLIKPTPLVIR